MGKGVLMSIITTGHAEEGRKYIVTLTILNTTARAEEGQGVREVLQVVVVELVADQKDVSVDPSTHVAALGH